MSSDNSMGATGMQGETATITHFFKQRRIMARITGGFASPAYYVYRLEMASSQKFDALQSALDDLQRVIFSARLMLGIIEDEDPRARVVAVSYTHLTLPTSDLV